MLEIKVPTVGESTPVARTTCCPGGRRPQEVTKGSRLTIAKQHLTVASGAAFAAPGQQVEPSAKVLFSACASRMLATIVAGGKTAAAVATTGYVSPRPRPRRGSHRGGTPAGVWASLNIIRWYRPRRAQPPATIVAFLRNAKATVRRLSLRSQVVVRTTHILYSSLYAY